MIRAVLGDWRRRWPEITVAVVALLMAVYLAGRGFLADLELARQEEAERARRPESSETEAGTPAGSEETESGPEEVEEIPEAGGVPVDLDGRWEMVRTVDRDGTVTRPPKLGRSILEFDSSREVVRVMEKSWGSFVRGANGDLTLYVPDSPVRMTVRPRRSGDALTLWVLEATVDDQDSLRRMDFRRLPDPPGGRWSDAGTLERVRSFYRGVFQFTGTNVPRDPKIATKLRSDLPEDLREPARLLESHVALLDREGEEEYVRGLARLVLSFSPESIDLLLERRSWTYLGLRGRREVASLLGYAESTTVATLAPLLGDPADPVILMALMLQTRHTFGSPPRFLLLDAPAPGPEIGAHWRLWLEEHWTDPPPAAEARLTAEAREILALFESRSRESEEAGLGRLAALYARSYGDYVKALSWDEETVDLRLNGLRDPAAIRILSWISEYRTD